MEKDDEISSQYNYIRCRQLEGTYSSDCTIGAWPISTLRIFYGWGAVSESAWPRAAEDEPWPPDEPDGLDALAKANRILYYQRIRDLADCQQSLKRMHPVSAAFDITSQWFEAPNGVIDLPGDDDETIGSHCICLLGLSEDGSQIQFVNSWGEGWGDGGIGYLPRLFFEKHLVSAWTMVDFPRSDISADTVQYVRRGYRAILGKMVHVREIYDPIADERLGWAMVVQREKYLDVEDFFVRPLYRKLGYGRDLAEMLRELAEETKLGIRVWFSHADEAGPVQQRLCSSLGLAVVRSGVPWARFKAVESSESQTSETHRATKPSVWQIKPS